MGSSLIGCFSKFCIPTHPKLLLNQARYLKKYFMNKTFMNKLHTEKLFLNSTFTKSYRVTISDCFSVSGCETSLRIRCKVRNEFTEQVYEQNL